MVKSTELGQNFIQVATIHSLNYKKFTFSEISHQYLSSDISFVWFRGSPNFPIVFSSDVIDQISENFLSCILVGLK